MRYPFMHGKRIRWFLAGAGCACVMSGCATSGQGNPPSITEAASPTPTDVSLTALPSETLNPPPGGPLTITILFDNIPSDPRLTTGWGFSALIEFNGEILLFDTGASGPVLLQNMKVLGIDPARVRHVVISHTHEDHTGGLADFLAASSHPPVFLLSEFGSGFVQSVKDQTEVVETAPGMEIVEGILTTGDYFGGPIHEQALVIRTSKGLVVITGCAHPGIVPIVEQAVALTGESVYLVMGGFHLLDKIERDFVRVLKDFRRLGIQKVSASHCTGEIMILRFAAEYGENWIAVGAGSVIRVED